MTERDLLFEIGTEELPADACAAAIEQLECAAPLVFAAIGLTHGSVRVLATPRRFVLHVEGLAAQGEATINEVKGPSVAAAFDAAGAFTRAAEGFAKSQGVTPADLIKKTEGKGEYVFALNAKPAPRAMDVLPELLAALVNGLEFGKSMRWGDYNMRFSRPIRWLLALYGDDEVAVELEMLSSGNITRGPRATGSQTINIKNTADYFKQIDKAGIVVDHAERRGLIEAEINAAAKLAKGVAAINPKVLDEVVFLIEAPNAVAGTFDEEFVDLPRSVVVTAMESHQRYFPVEDKDGRLLPAFVVVHNGAKASAAMIRTGHERVLRARLADALFFYEEDGKTTLTARVNDLKEIVFQEKLGTVYDKAARVKELTAEIADQLNYTDDETAGAELAAMLAKADLTTNMVREFPDLQGAVGEEYAKRDGHPAVLASAIREHYLPKSFGDSLPATKGGVAVSLADKIDTLTGCFGIGLIPTGSEDPYALRRQAQGIVSIILDEKLGLELEPLVAGAVFRFERQGVKIRPAGDIFADVEDFLKGRLKFHFTYEGFRYDIADAVLETELNDLVSLEATARALNGMLGSDTLNDVLTGFERCFNLSKNAGEMFVDATVFTDPAEGQLLSAVEQAEADFEKYEEDGNVKDYVTALARLRPSIDKYFDDVLVMDKDPKVKNNRLALLKKCARLYLAVADFSKIVREGN